MRLSRVKPALTISVISSQLEVESSSNQCGLSEIESKLVEPIIKSMCGEKLVEFVKIGSKYNAGIRVIKFIHVISDSA